MGVLTKRSPKSAAKGRKRVRWKQRVEEIKFSNSFNSKYYYYFIYSGGGDSTAGSRGKAQIGQYCESAKYLKRRRIGRGLKREGEKKERLGSSFVGAARALVRGYALVIYFNKIVRLCT